MKTINRIFILLIAAAALTACNELKYKDLFEQTDYFVEQLETTYQSYGLAGGEPRYTSDREYRIMPIGRLINVRKEKLDGGPSYEELKDILKSHYKGDKRVNDVFINGYGTIMIDCRN